MNLLKEELTFSQLRPLMIADLKAGLTPALLGEPGIGKSALIEDLGREFKTKVFTLPVNQLGERSDLTGARITKNEHGDYAQTFFPHQTIRDAIRYAEDHPDELPILFMDEFNRTSTDITSAILSFQTLREVGNHRFPDNLRMIVAGNDKGNVTSLDKASITRFAVYRVKPDIETFMSIQTLNKFVEQTMRENPELLLAPQLQEAVDEDDDGDTFDLQSEFMDDDGFTQQTVPRTITYTSEWLTNLGLDQSGSDDELKVLQSLLGTTTDESDALMAGIIAHAGNTDFSIKLHNILKKYFNDSLSGSSSKSSVAVLNRFKPVQEIINQLSKATDTTVVSDIVQQLDDNGKQNLLIWLFENRSARDIDNNQTVLSTISELSYSIDELSSDHTAGLMSILSSPKSVNEAGIKEFIETDTDLGRQYKDIVSTILGI